MSSRAASTLPPRAPDGYYSTHDVACRAQGSCPAGARSRARRAPRHAAAAARRRARAGRRRRDGSVRLRDRRGCAGGRCGRGRRGARRAGARRRAAQRRGRRRGRRGPAVRARVVRPRWDAPDAAPHAAPGAGDRRAREDHPSGRHHPRRRPAGARRSAGGVRAVAVRARARPDDDAHPVRLRPPRALRFERAHAAAPGVRPRAAGPRLVYRPGGLRGRGPEPRPQPRAYRLRGPRRLVRARALETSPGTSACTHAAGRYHRGTTISRLLRSTASSRRSTTSWGSITIAFESGRPKRARCGNPSVSTKPGLTVCTLTSRAASSTASERENASWACFDAEYGPTATVPATDTTFTTWAPAPSPGRNASVVHTEPR